MVLAVPLGFARERSHACMLVSHSPWHAVHASCARVKSTGTWYLQAAGMCNLREGGRKFAGVLRAYLVSCPR